MEQYETRVLNYVYAKSMEQRVETKKVNVVPPLQLPYILL